MLTPGWSNFNWCRHFARTSLQLSDCLWNHSISSRALFFLFLCFNSPILACLPLVIPYLYLYLLYCNSLSILTAMVPQHNSTEQRQRPHEGLSDFHRRCTTLGNCQGSRQYQYQGTQCHNFDLIIQPKQTLSVIVSKLAFCTSCNTKPINE